MFHKILILHPLFFLIDRKIFLMFFQEMILLLIILPLCLVNQIKFNFFPFFI